MAVVDADVQVLNNYEDWVAKLRTRASGKQRVTLQVKSEAVGILVSEQALGRPIADAIAERFRTVLGGIQESVATGTLLARKYARSSWDRGGSSEVRRRYSGGRIGPMAPNADGQGRWLNDSGRFVKSLVSMWVEATQAFMVNTAANRLTSDQPELRQRVLAKIEQHMSEILNPEALKPAIEQAMRAMTAKGRDVLLLQLKASVEKSRTLGGALEELAAEEPPPRTPRR